MAKSLATILREMRQDGSIEDISQNPRAQFGTPTREYLGASLMPERPVRANAYTERQIKYRTVIANAGTRYSPTQKKGGKLIGSMKVMLAESDVASEFTAEDHDALLEVLASNQTEEGVAQITNWLDAQVNIPLVEWIERARWQAIVSALVLLRGDNQYTEDVAYSNPANHRSAAGGTWSSDAYDPYEDIFAKAQLLADKGYPLRRIIASRNVVSILAGNDKVKARAGSITISGGSIVAQSGRATLAQINQALADNGLPPIEMYDLQYQTTTTTGRFLPNTVMVFIGTTGETADVNLGPDVLQPLDNVLGYAAVGRAAGQGAPGRVVRAESFENKPPRIEGEGWQTALPVITVPEAIGVITGIA